MRFAWDPHKARANELKHGVPFEDAVTVFADPLALVVDDGGGAGRAVILGRSRLARVLCVVFFEEREDALRILSARPATRNERRVYEEGEGD